MYVVKCGHPILWCYFRTYEAGMVWLQSLGMTALRPELNLTKSR